MAEGDIHAAADDGQGRQGADDDGIGKDLEDTVQALLDGALGVSRRMGDGCGAKARFVGEGASAQAPDNGLFERNTTGRAAERLGRKGCGKDLKSIAQIDMSSLVPEARKSEFIVACDVNTPFCGLNGAAHVFAPQKGADPQMVKALDDGMYSFAKIIAEQFQKDIIPLSGAGAAGGLGGAFKAFLNARLTKGIEMVLDAIGFDSILEGADLVITGEGRIDFQTATGKTAAGILRHAKQKGIPTLAIGGSVEICQELKEMGFIGIYSIINTPISLEKAMQKDSAPVSQQLLLWVSG